MTFILNERYPSRANTPSSDYMRGSVKNRSSAVAEDGTYLEQDWINDERAFFDRLLKEAGITPNGNVDTMPNCQTWDALVSIIATKISINNTPFFAIATGSANAIAATYTNSEFQLRDGMRVLCRATYVNTSTVPTFNPNNTGAKRIIKGNGQVLTIGDIQGAGHILDLVYDSRYNAWALLNPAFALSQPETIPVGVIAYFGRSGTVNGWLPMTGGTYSRSQYAALVAACPNIVISTGNASTFKLPDTRGYFMRVLAQGSSVDPDSKRTIGSTQGDAIRNITGNFGYWDGTNYPRDGVFSWGTNTNNKQGKSGSDGGEKRDVNFDASRVVPTAAENRPKNMAFPLYIKY